MPKFVAVTDPEKALAEQHGDPSLAKHREWEAKQYVTVNRDGGAGPQECIAMAKKTTGKQKMVLKNGLWVKVQAEEPVSSSSSKGGSVFASRNEFGEKIGSASARSDAQEQREYDHPNGDKNRGRDERDGERGRDRRERDRSRGRRDRSPDRDRGYDRDRDRDRDRDHNRDRDHRDRDYDRDRDRDHDYGRDRDRGRDRGRRDRSRSRERERDRDRDYDRDRDRDRDYDRDRDRNRDRNRDRERERSRERSGAGGTNSGGRRREREDSDDGGAAAGGLTAAQAANMLCEVWSAPAAALGRAGGGGRAALVARCFAEDAAVTSLDSGDVLQRGRNAIRAAVAAAGEPPEGAGDGPPPAAEASLSLFLESKAGGGGDGDRRGRSDSDGDDPGPTAALHIYEAGHAPGFEAEGFTGRRRGGGGAGGRVGKLAVLYVVADGAIVGVWVTGDVPGGRTRAGLTEEWKLWGKVVAAARGWLGPGPVTVHCNDYLDVEDKLGLGLATTSRSESWEER